MDPKELIFDAIRKNNINLVRDLIYQIDNLDFINVFNPLFASDHDESPLMYASRLERIEIIMILLDAGTNIDFANQKGYTALTYATYFNKITTIRILLNAGANVNLQIQNGSTALMIAAKKDNKEIVLALIDAGADINILDDYDRTALLIAAEKGNKEIVIALLNAGADINIQKKNGKTALMDASFMGYGKIVPILLEAGANIKLKDKNGLTVLDIAFKFKDLNIVDPNIAVLIENYIPDDPDQADNDGFTNLMIVAFNGPTYKLREFLRRVKNIDAQDPRGNTALIYAVLNKNLQRTELLLDAGANPLLENPEGISAYYYMLKSLDKKMRKLGKAVFIASTQSDIITSEFRTYHTRRAAEKFQREYQEEGEEFNFPENLRPEFREYYAECAKDDNWEKVFRLAEILGVPRERIENKSQEEICIIIRRFISLLT